MQLRYVFTELGQMLRRNITMHIAVVLTLFVALTLVGVGVLMQKEADKTAQYLGTQLQITVWLCTEDDDNRECLGEVTEAQSAAIEKQIEANPEVSDFHYESQDVAFENTKELLGPEKFEGPNPILTADDLRASWWITLADPEEAEGITSAVSGLDGVSYVADLREELSPVYGAIDALKYGSLGVAAFLVLAALLLVANTIRLAALARRKEIGIMRLVGASTLYITLPFLLEALVTAAVGVALAAGAMGAFVKFAIIDGISQDLRFLPWVGWSDYSFALVCIAILGPVLTLLPTLLLTRKYIKV